MNSILIGGSSEAQACVHAAALKDTYQLAYEPDHERVGGLAAHQHFAALIVPPYPHCQAPAAIIRQWMTHGDGASILWLRGDSEAEQAVDDELSGSVYEVLPADVSLKVLQDALRRAAERSTLLVEHALLQNRLMTFQLGLQRAKDIRAALVHPVDNGDSLPFAIDGFDIGSYERPAEGQGGDFHGWFTLPDNRLVVYLGDAAGHDLAATVIRDYVTEELALLHAREKWEVLGDPASILDHLNTLMYPAKQVHASLLYLVIDQETHQVWWASAGQTPFVARTASGHVDMYFSTSVMLGIEPEVNYTNREIYLDHYSHLTLYSDGLLTVRDTKCQTIRSDDFSTDHLKEFHRFAPDDPRLFARMIYRHYLQVRGDARIHTDDISVLCIRTGVPFTPVPLSDTLPPIPERQNTLISDMLGLSGQVGAEVGYDAEAKTFYVAIHGQADLRIATAVVLSVRQAIQRGMQVLVLDCLDSTALDSCFIGTMQELYVLCKRHGIRFRICLGHREMLDTINEHRLKALSAHITPERWPWHKALKPIVRKQRLDSQEDMRHIYHSHQILASQSPENYARYIGVLRLLEEELLQHGLLNNEEPESPDDQKPDEQDKQDGQEPDEPDTTDEQDREPPPEAHDDDRPPCQP